jgi:methyl-accepting chemotaxis protein
MYPILVSIDKIKRKLVDIDLFEKAKVNAYNLPIIDGITVLVRWTLSGLSVGAYLTLTGKGNVLEFLASTFMLFLTGLVCLPIYYFIAEGECLQFINLPEIRDVKINSNVFVFGIVQKVAVSIYGIIIYSMGILVLIIYLSIINYLNLSNTKTGMILLLISTTILVFLLVKLLTTNMKNSFDKINETAKVIIKGDFTKRIALEQKDEIGQVIKAFDTILNYSSG